MYTLGKTTKVGWQGLSRQCFLQKQSMIQRKVLFPLIEDSLMFEDLPLFIKYMARKEIVSNSNFFYFEVVRVCLFVCCNGVCKFGLSSTKTKFE